MWARKRRTGRVEHWWLHPYPGQLDVWQPRCMKGLTVNPERGIVKVRKNAHKDYFIEHPSGSQRCLSCEQRLFDDEIAQYRQKLQEP